MFQVVEIVLQFAFGFRCVAGVHMKLCPSNKARANRVARFEVGNFISELLDDSRLFWTWANEAHVTTQDVDPLRKLVEACCA